MEPGSDRPIWYFGYGSNMSPATFLGRRQMRPLQTRWGWLDGFRLSFNIPVGSGERSVANVEADDKGRTCGVLYLLPPVDCDRLDRTEGVPAGLYRRIAVAVAVGEQRVPAFTYQSSLTQAGRKPSARYMGLLLEGARHHGLPPSYIHYLESFDLAWDEREGERR